MHFAQRFFSCHQVKKNNFLEGLQNSYQGILTFCQIQIFFFLEFFL